jgi:hypothetical protein
MPNGHAFRHLKHAVGSASPFILGVAVPISFVGLNPVVADIEKPAGPHNAMKFIDDGFLVDVCGDARQHGEQQSGVE